MYLTARQFKNAIDKNEMFLIPAKKNNVEENTVLVLGGTFTLTARGNKIMTRILPFLVNKSFACEVYLKLILLEENVNFNILLKNYEKHNLFKLYNLTNVKEDCKNYLKNYDKKLSDDYINDEIKKISNVFMEWRYIYEHFNQENIVNSDFLNIFCEFLDEYSIKLIQDVYNYDVTKDIR